MYTDERFCFPCFNRDLFMDGDNFCSKCQNYLCLSCTKDHGFTCGKGALDTKKDREQHKPWNKNTDAKCKEVLPNTLSNNVDVKMSSFQIKNSGHNSANGFIWLEGSPKPYGNNQEEVAKIRQTEKETEKKVRQTISSRGSAVRITRSSSYNVEKKFQRCCDHPDMVIENFCTNHCALCCENCLSLKHKLCTIQPIDEVAHDVFESGIVETYIHEFAIAKVKLNEMVLKFELCLISKRRNKRHIEKKKEKEEREKLENLKIKCNEVDENVSISLAEIKNAKESKNEVFTFITLKRNENMLKHAKAKTAELLKICEIFIPEGEISPLQDTQNCHIQEEDVENKARKYTIKEYNLNNISVTREVDNKIVIGDVVLKLSGTRKTNNDIDNQHSYDNEEIIANEPTGHRDDEKGNQEDKKSVIQNKSDTNRLTLKAKKLDFKSYSTNTNALGKQTKHSVKTYGLTTEYYLTNDVDEEGEIRVLRLQSAPPERTPGLNTDHRSNSADRLKHKAICRGRDSHPKNNSSFEQNAVVHTQSSKMIRSAENETESKRMMLDEFIKQNSSNKSKTKWAIKSKKPILETETEYLPQSNAYKQRQYQRQHMKTKRAKPSIVSKKKSILSKTRADESTLAAIISSHEGRDADFRLKQWIKQTEEISKKYMHRNKISSLNSSENIDSEIDTAHNMNESDCFDKQHCVPLTTKEATVISVLDPDNRQSSAKSRTSESEKAHYNIQSYAHPPKSQLVLSHEKIVRIPDDDSLCEINSIACLPDGRVLISDFSNMQLKLLSIENGDIFNLKMEEPPHDVTVVSNSNAAAITGLAYDAVLIISVGQMLKIKRRFKTDCVCKAIESYESHIYLLCLYRYRTEIHILSMDGVVNIRFNLGHAIPSPKSIAINALDGLIYIVDQNRGIYTVERCGKIVSRCFDKNIQEYIDVETDLNNSKFVSTRNPCGIYELDYDGKHLLPILYDYRAEIVKAIAYNTANNSLVVGSANSEAIQIYKIHNSLAWKKK